jgi:hypothetical protein
VNTKLNALSEGLIYTSRIDLKAFNDDLAAEIEWKPLNKLGSSNFPSKKLVLIGGSHAVIKTTNQVKAFVSIWFVGWIGAWFWLGVPFAPLAILLGVALFYPLLQIQQFNKTSGFEYGWPWKNELTLIARCDMYALQIIRGGRRMKYQTFELNLVANSGTRHAIFKEANLVCLEGAADELSGIFGIPIWNAVRK